MPSAMHLVEVPRSVNLSSMISSDAIKLIFLTGFWCLGYFNSKYFWLACGVLLIIYALLTAFIWRSYTQDEERKFANLKDFLKWEAELCGLEKIDATSPDFLPDATKVDWVNKVIQQIWPHLDNFVKTYVKGQVETAIQQSSSLLSSFHFMDIDIGKRAPAVAGIKVYGDVKEKRNAVIMDALILFNSRCKVGVNVNGLKAGVRDLSIQGLLRVELSPFLDDIPLIGAVSVAFVRDPSISFDLTHLANLFDFPGFDVLLRGAIAQVIRGILVLPERLIFSLSEAIDISKVKYPTPRGLIRITVLEAMDIMEKDNKIFGFGGKSDPFVSVVVGHHQRFRTKTIVNAVNPVWNETFDVYIRDIEMDKIEFIVYDDDGSLNPADFIGCVKIRVKTAFQHGVIDEVIRVTDSSNDALHVRLECFDLSDEPADFEGALELTRRYGLPSAYFSVFARGAKNLMAQQHEEATAQWSPFLTISTQGEETAKTSAANDAINPLWEENFQFLLHNPIADDIVFQIEDSWGKTGNLGTLKYPPQQLMEMPGMTVEHSFSLDKAEEASMLDLRMCLRILKLRSKSIPGTVMWTMSEPSTTSFDVSNEADESQTSLPVERAGPPKFCLLM